VVQTKQQKIDLLTKRISNLKAAIKNPETFEYQIFSSSSPKQDRIRAWAVALEQLHELGEYPDSVNTISSHIASELKALGAEKVIPYARQVLSFKYKDDTKIHSESLLSYDLERIREDNLREKLNNQELYFRQNKRYIDEIADDILMLAAFAKKLEATEFVGKLDPDVLDEHFTAKRQGRKNIKEMLDNRTSVMPEKLHMLIHGFIEGTKAHAYSEYVKILLETISITPKQTVRLLTGRVTKIESLYEPKNMFEARHKGFHGTNCDECGSWRVDVRYNTDSHRDRLFCFACKEWSDIKTLSLMDKEI
jgi:hypothetical protein